MLPLDMSAAELSLPSHRQSHGLTDGRHATVLKLLMTPCLSSCFFFFSCIHSLNVLTNANALLPSHFQSFLLFPTPAGYRHVYLEGMTEASIFVHITVHDIYGKVSL